MGELGRCQDLAPEAADGFGTREPVLADHLQGHEPVHPLLARFEDLPHAALADPFQDEVLPQDQLVSFSLEKLVDLVRRQPVALEQFPGQGAGIGEARDGLGQLAELVGVEDSGLAQGVQEGCGGLNQHSIATAGWAGHQAARIVLRYGKER